MRRHGLAESPDALGADGHACWGFDHVDELADPAAAFLAEGRELGQRLMFVGGAEAEAMLRDTDPMRSMIRDGILQVAPFEAIYPGGRRLPSAEQWAMYAGATDQAKVDGFTGLRVLAEVTALAGPAGAWPEQVGWESYADRRMANGQLAALCCFDRQALPVEAMGALACAHPVAERRLQPLTPFRVFGRGDAMAVAGEVDGLSSGQLHELLELTIPDTDGEVALDLSSLDFIDHAGVRVIVDFERRMHERGARLTLRGEPAIFRRLADLLDTEPGARS